MADISTGTVPPFFIQFGRNYHLELFTACFSGEIPFLLMRESLEDLFSR
jgi:hypothetical protein